MEEYIPSSLKCKPSMQQYFRKCIRDYIKENVYCHVSVFSSGPCMVNKQGL